MNEQILAFRRVKYKKIIKIAKGLLEFFDVHPRDDRIYVWFFYPFEYVVAVLFRERIYIVQICERDDYFLTDVDWTPFNGYGPNGVPEFPDIYLERDYDGRKRLFKIS